MPNIFIAVVIDKNNEKNLSNNIEANSCCRKCVMYYCKNNFKRIDGMTLDHSPNLYLLSLPNNYYKTDFQVLECVVTSV